jgi:hypothetical protein
MDLEPDKRDAGGMSGMPSNEGPETIMVPGSQMSEYLASMISKGREQTSTREDLSMHQGQIINYYFPVEVEVVGRLSHVEVQRIAQYVYDELTIALQS